MDQLDFYRRAEISVGKKSGHTFIAYSSKHERKQRF